MSPTREYCECPASARSVGAGAGAGTRECWARFLHIARMHGLAVAAVTIANNSTGIYGQHDGHAALWDMRHGRIDQQNPCQCLLLKFFHNNVFFNFSSGSEILDKF